MSRSRPESRRSTSTSIHILIIRIHVKIPPLYSLVISTIIIIATTTTLMIKVHVSSKLALAQSTQHIVVVVGNIRHRERAPGRMTHEPEEYRYGLLWGSQSREGDLRKKNPITPRRSVGSYWGYWGWG